jgi:ATP-binding cassette subfamily B protein
MKKLLKFLKGYELETTLAPLFKLLEAFFELIVPIIMAKIVDIGIANSNVDYIWKMGGILLLLGILGFSCSMTSQYFSAKSAAGYGTALRSAFLKHINTFSHRELDKIGIPSLVTRMTNDIMQTQNSVNMFLRLFTRAPFIVIGAVIASFTIDYKMGFIFLATTPLIGLVIYFIMKGTLPTFKKVQKNIDKLSLLTRENLEGSRVIRAFSKQEEEINEFNENTNQLANLQIKANKISSLNNPLTYVIANLAIVCILYFGSIRVFSGNLTQGQLIALVNYMTQILLAMLASSLLVVILSKATASAQRIVEVLELDSSITGAGAMLQSNCNSTTLEFDNVNFSYNEGGENVLCNISFSANKGEKIGIIGGTGSGKSTIVNLIPRFYNINKGSIKIEGNDIINYPLDVLRNKIGIVEQKSVLFNGTIRENICWGKENASDEEIIKALELAQIKNILKEKSGLDSIINQNGTNLSGGQRQRLAIARAIIKNPDILIFDDSTSALDNFTEAQLKKSINSNFIGAVILWVSQRISTVKNCDKIIVLNNGEIVGIGTHKQLLDSCVCYKDICLSQLPINKEAL